jgi:hypothetical protein
LIEKFPPEVLAVLRNSDLQSTSSLQTTGLLMAKQMQRVKAIVDLFGE